MNNRSSPPYHLVHDGPAIVCGNAACLHDDLEIARKIFTSAAIMAVNGASREVRADFIFSYHPERFIEIGSEWKRHQRRLFGNTFTVHGASFKPDMPWVDYWWPLARGGGGSAWGARKVAGLMGFSPVVLCGAPLVPMNYTNHRMGMNMTKPEIVGQYAREIASDVDWHEGCYSMSGRTREILGSL